jgi:hypothetical protein
MNIADLNPPSDMPVADAWLPGVTVRIALALVGMLLTLDVFGTSGWLAMGIIFSLLAAAAPEYLFGWAVILLLGLGQLNRPAGVTWQLLILLAGIHLLHILGTFALAVPWRSWLQPRIFGQPLLRFLSIQIPVQLLAVVALLVLAPNAHGHRPLAVGAFAIIGAAALAALTLLLLRRKVSGPAWAESKDALSSDTERG